MPDPVSTALGLCPGKVIAVHLNYPSRAAQRGRAPRYGSYFLKATSSLAADGGEVARPEGVELLAFEGEVALVIGTGARSVPPEAGWSHVGWVSAANDLGLYDLRHADAGSNLRAKSGDGFTPIGPGFLPAAELDPAGLRVRTWVNGELVQSDSTDTLFFPFGQLVADLSRLSTLEPGDVILTGTPRGASVIEPGDVVEVEVDSIARGRPASTGRLRTTAVAGPPLRDWGAPPKVDDALRAAAFGVEADGEGPDGDGPDDEVMRGLTRVSVATLSAQLRSRGLNNVHIAGVRPAGARAKFAGRAKTLRYLPMREDLFRARGGGYNAQKQAVDRIGAGEVLVIEARGVPDAGTIGDILALRAQVRGASAIVTDGGLRDAEVVAGLDIPVFYGGVHPAVLGRRHVPWESDVAIACGGATVCPGDVLVGDEDGVLVIPPSLVGEVLAAAVEQELREEFITEQVRSGQAVAGLYPLGAQWRSAYQEWLRKRNGDD